jgi:hypothetical protein
MAAGTEERVPRNTKEELNRRIQERIEASLDYYSSHRGEIDQRLEELRREWDIERTLQANAASLGLAGILLGALVDRRLLFLPAMILGFLLQHAVQGWCPPLPLFRRLGIRTTSEIGMERTALKALRGDFVELASNGSDGDAQHAARGMLAALRR